MIELDNKKIFLRRVLAPGLLALALSLSVLPWAKADLKGDIGCQRLLTLVGPHHLGSGGSVVAVDFAHLNEGIKSLTGNTH